MSNEYEKIRDLIEAHTSALQSRMDRSDKRVSDKLDGIETTLLNLSTHGCMKGAEQDKRLEKLETAPARIGAVIIGLTTVVSSIVSMIWLLLVHLRGGGQ